MTTLSVTSANTLGNLKTRIADELARSDLTSQIALAIDDAIDIACTNRFWFQEVRGLQLNLSANNSYYTDADIDALLEIDRLYLQMGSVKRNLRLASNDRLDALANGSPSYGEPQTYSRYGGEIRFWPTPSQAYTVILHGVTRGQVMEDDADSSIWTTYGEKLIRALAKRELYAHVIRNTQKAETQEKLAESYKDTLLRQTASRAMTGEMAAFGV